jgi:hypothetical protein
LRRGLVRTAVAAAVVFAVAAVAAIAGQGPGLAPSAANAPDPALKPTRLAATPTHFKGDVRQIPKGRVRKIDRRPEPQIPNDAPGGVQQPDAVLQTTEALAAAPGASTFDGLDYANWGAGWPPDTNGDVGRNHYIETVNTSVGIYDKSGTRLAAFTFDGLFSAADTGTPCDTSNQGDPVVLYDPFGDRWIISDFAWTDYASGAMYECMAVSRSDDPVAGGWYFYAWKLNNGGVLPDYPKLGVWPDGIYMSTNNFATTGSGSFQNVQVYAFDRVTMEAGGSATAVQFAVPRTVGGVSVFSLLPSNARSVTGAPPAGAPNYFASIWGSYNIRVWKFHVDWSNPANSTFTGPTNATIGTFSVGPGNVPEQTGNNLDTLSYRLMMQNQYTNLGGAESLWLTHTVGSGGTPNVARVRWYELRVTGGAVATSPRQQSTWAPDSKNRFMPSLAVDRSGDMAIGYSVSDATMSPAIRYAGRLAGDALGTLGQSETTLWQGTGYQCCNFSDGTLNTRWGDYSAMTIDPVDGCTFWYAGEYTDAHPTTLQESVWRTRIGSFKFDSCGTEQPPPPPPSATPTISSFSPKQGRVGTGVTVGGTNLTGASSVKFNGTSASFTVSSSTQIQAIVPGGATTGPISVTTGGGTATSSSSFRVR